MSRINPERYEAHSDALLDGNGIRLRHDDEDEEEEEEKRDRDDSEDWDEVDDEEDEEDSGYSV